MLKNANKTECRRWFRILNLEPKKAPTNHLAAAQNSRVKSRTLLSEHIQRRNRSESSSRRLNSSTAKCTISHKCWNVRPSCAITWSARDLSDRSGVSHSELGQWNFFVFFLDFALRRQFRMFHTNVCELVLQWADSQGASKMRKRNNALKEIITTERDFVGHLNKVMEVRKTGTNICLIRN